MILDKMRENFLIIGFTGPLRSGCSTAAEILRDSLSREASEGGKLISRYQDEIQNTYKDILTQKEAGEEENELRDLRRGLLHKIKIRHILNALSIHADDKPTYISMTEMLLKSVIEYWWTNRGKIKIETPDDEDRNSCEFVLKQINDNIFPDLEEIAGSKDSSVNNIIKKRKYNELGPDNERNIKLYNNYIDHLKFIRNKISTEFNSQYGEMGANRYGKVLQDLGDNIRRCSNPFDYISSNKVNSSIWSLSEQANDLIKFYKNCYRFWESKEEYKNFLSPHIFVIENFRNPFEAEYFRLRYYEFFLISIHCNKRERLRREYENNPTYKAKRLKIEQIEKYFDAIDKRDSGEDNLTSEIFRQNVRKAVYLSDIAIINEDSKEEFIEKILKYYTLIRNPGAFQPTNDELLMHIAYSLSLRSRCISRKVGAVIVGERNYVIGAGWNEVGEGQIGCGDRIVKDIIGTDNESVPIEVRGKDSFRKYLSEKYRDKTDMSFCFREQYQAYLEKEQKDTKEKEKSDNGTEKTKNNSKQQQLCRALHAEENAIIQTAKIGGMGVNNGTIYTTTFPCELCAKKIAQSGIRKIVYTEPYPNAISEDVFLRDGIRKIDICPFEGVKSHSYYRLYQSTFNVKDSQNLEG